VVVSVINTDLSLMPGMTAYVSFVIDERSNVLLLPNAALRFKPTGGAERAGKPQAVSGQPERRARPAGPVVHVIRDNRLVAVPVQIGISDGKFTEVLDGLSAGDRVVVEDTAPDQKGNGPPSSFRMRAF
jgi:HlyD family secretion protein